MFVDSFTQLASAQALTSTGAVSEDYIDLQNARDIGIGEPLALVINVKVAAGGTAPTLTASVEVDDNTSFSSATVVCSTGALAAAALTLGAQIVLPIPPLSTLITSNPSAAEGRYLRANLVLGGTTPTLTVDAQIMPMSMIQNYRSYADAVTIS
jgi:hypothetical protein